MQAYAATHTAQGASPDFRPTTLQRFGLALVWLGVASGAVVFSEPAPVDLLTIGLIAFLPMVGLVAVPPALWLVTAVWAVCGACALLACSFAPDLAKAATHTGVSIYLYAAFFMFAAFVAKRPLAHTKLILDAYLWAAFIAGLAGVVGYFNLFPGAFELFTRYGRATGTFKDSNVYGPFLIPALLYALHKVLNEPARRTIVPAVMLMFLSFAILLSFSRGAWFNAVVGIAFYMYFSFVFAPSNRQRVKLVLLGAAALVTAAGVLVVAARSEGISELLSHRAALTQDYDVGPQGRFGGQEKAKGLILANPFGIGAQVFAAVHHHEEPHNVYLVMFLNAGWLGGLAFAAIVWLTALWGLRHAMLRTLTQPLFVIVYAAFLGNALEGFIIDIDHWRHLHLEMAIVWGLRLADRTNVAARHALAPVGRRDGRLVRRLTPVRATA